MKTRMSVQLIGSHFILILIGFFLNALPVQAQQVTMTPYFPLHPGDWWKTSSPTSGVHTDSILPNSIVINSVHTMVDESDNGCSTYWTNDSAGIRLHRMYCLSDGSTLTYVPSMLMIPPQEGPGKTVGSSGIVDIGLPTQDAYQLNYTANSSFVDEKVISVPYGTFNSIHLKITVRYYGVIKNQSFDVTTIREMWLADGIGIIKLIEEIPGEQRQEGVLIDSNLPHNMNIVPQLLPLLLEKHTVG